MKEDSSKVLEFPSEIKDSLTEILREGARKLLQDAIESEVEEYLSKMNGEKIVAVRNGYLPEREIQSGIGAVRITQPRVRAKAEAVEEEKFSSKILPPYLRRTKAMVELLPWLYLKGISTGGFSDALVSLLGKNAPGLSATTITRLKKSWEEDYKIWNERSLERQQYVYIWADGIYFNVRLGEDKRMCVLVIMGATPEGKKELLAIEAGYRESELSWTNLLLSLRDRGLHIEPKLAIADGALGFWAALPKVYGKTKPQRCWVHKTANVLDKLPKSKQQEAKKNIHEIYLAETKKEAEKAFDRFVSTYEAKYKSATDCLRKDRDKLLTFYDFPAEHWLHVRTTNPIESTFASVRLRTNKTKGCGSVEATLSMAFKLTQAAEKSWKKLNGAKLLADVISMKFKFVDGIKQEAA